MTGGLGEAGRARLERLGVAALSSGEGLELFDRARGAGEALLVAARLERSGLRAQARAGVLPAVLGDLVAVPVRSGRVGGAGGSLARRLGGVPESEWDAVVLEVVRGEVAGVLGHSSADRVDPERAFKDLGFDSLSVVELRNRLVQVTGLRLPSTLAFDYPNCVAVAKLLRTLVEGRDRASVERVAIARKGTSEELVAIVGMGCRYPGGVRDSEGLWELVTEGRDAISEIPADRGWDLRALRDTDSDAEAGYTYEGGFVHDAGEFDAGFFGISPREALGMDPQQRLLLEIAWEALEDAGIDPGSLRGSQTGVFAGTSMQDYLSPRDARGGEREGFGLTGYLGSVLSGRVAYTFGFEGPAVSVDTACSSSLVALHLACQALRQGECSLALAGGVTLMATPAMLIEFRRQRGLAVDGRCKAFAASADGTGGGEGAGLVVVERLSDARRLGHRVLGVVRGSAVNQDGASNGLSAPNGPSQERVILRALAQAGLSPGDVDVVEAHGTGTTLGDPIEAQALLATYGQGRAEGPLWLGSLKSNIGHTQAAAGVGGVIKMVKAFEHGVLPETLHVDQPTPHVDWSAGEVELLTAPQEWAGGERPRRAGVSSFGISGTNAHVILEEPPVEAGVGAGVAVFGGAGGLAAGEGAGAGEAGAGEGAGAGEAGAGEGAVVGVGGVWGCGVVPLVVSGKGEPALCGQAGRLREFLQGRPEVGLLDVAWSLVSSRARFEDRAVVLGGGRDELLAGLAALERGEDGVGVVRGVAREGRTAFLFTGQGAQRTGMGAGLYEAFPVFREALDEVCGSLDGLVELGEVEGGLRSLLFAEEGSPGAELLDRTEFTQVALFAFEVALLGLVESWGVRPDFVGGHSVGELVAAYAAGVFSLGDACRLVTARGRLMGALPEGGAMFSVEASEREIRESLEGSRDGCLLRL